MEMQEINVYMNAEHRYAGQGNKKDTIFRLINSEVGLGFDESVILNIHNLMG